MVAALCVCVVGLLASSASATTPTWTYGSDTTFPAFDCQIYTNTSPPMLSIDPIGGDGYVGYYGIPTAGQVYYVGLVYEAVTQSIISDGSCSSSQDVSMRIALPPDTSPVGEQLDADRLLRQRRAVLDRLPHECRDRSGAS